MLSDFNKLYKRYHNSFKRRFIKTIFTFTAEYTKEDLLDILDRFKIQYSQERIQERNSLASSPPQTGIGVTTGTRHLVRALFPGE